jgi:hypothetical protein
MRRMHNELLTACVRKSIEMIDQSDESDYNEIFSATSSHSDLSPIHP